MRKGSLLLISTLLAADVGAQPQPARGALEEAAGDRIVAVASSGDTAYAALESGGVAVLNVSEGRPRLVRTIASGRRVAHLVVADGVLYLMEVKHEVLPFSISDPRDPVAVSLVAPPSSPDAPPQETAGAPLPAAREPSAVQARVLSLERGRVIFDRGADDGFLPGEHVKIISQRLQEKPDLVTGGTRQVPSDEVTAVLRIEHAEKNRAMAELGRGDRATPGDLVELTDGPVSEQLLLPRMAPFTLRAGFHVRPFLGLGRSGYPVGALADLFAAYVPAGSPLSLEVALAPFGVAVGGAVPHYPSLAWLTAAYATDHFEVGVGVGGITANPSCPVGGICLDPSAFTINQIARLGSLDGLNFTWRSAIAAATSGFTFAAARGEGHMPINSRLGLFGGFGAAGAGGLRDGVAAVAGLLARFASVPRRSEYWRSMAPRLDLGIGRARPGGRCCCGRSRSTSPDGA